MLNIGVLVSGGGTNLQALIDAINKGKINGKIVTVVSNKKDAYALERAKNNNIPSTVISKKNYPNVSEFSIAIANHMKDNQIDLIVMAGFLSIIDSNLINAYHNRIMNIHPSLIPSFCGDGYYGLKVHEEALRRGVKVTGATVHFVNELVDGGPIILQKSIRVKDSDTPEILQQRVMKQAEWIILPKAVQLFCDDKLIVEKNKVIIKK
jgi:phosphoribosylglycinamide formyltransferase-1